MVPKEQVLASIATITSESHMKKGLHKCDTPFLVSDGTDCKNGYQIDYCVEHEDGTLHVVFTPNDVRNEDESDDTEFQVNFCPICGYEAKVKVNRFSLFGDKELNPSISANVPDLSNMMKSSEDRQLALQLFDRHLLSESTLLKVCGYKFEEEQEQKRCEAIQNLTHSRAGNALK